MTSGHIRWDVRFAVLGLMATLGIAGGVAAQAPDVVAPPPAPIPGATLANPGLPLAALAPASPGGPSAPASGLAAQPGAPSAPAANAGPARRGLFRPAGGGRLRDRLRNRRHREQP